MTTRKEINELLTEAEQRWRVVLAAKRLANAAERKCKKALVAWWANGGEESMAGQEGS